ncbi:MAG: phosphohydrolase [Thermoprotei archaeon ex4572_64]|nr:MAG: phosphohydrolase [Thermoprotei archaeon ex4572_64]
MLRFSKQIRDPVHGWIKLTSDEVELIDNSQHVQRLKYVYQLGLAYQVYPSARHTRFEHSLGVLHVSTLMTRNLLKNLERSEVKKILENLEIHDESRDGLILHVRFAALLHDLGHLPFSHSTESITIPSLVKVLNYLDGDVCRDRILFINDCLNIAKEHEWITYMTLTYNDDLLKIINETNPHINLRTVKLLLFTKIFKKLLRVEDSIRYVPDLNYLRSFEPDDFRRVELISNVLSGELDADRIDYILRDLYFTGASVSTNLTTSDIERILDNLRVINHDIVFDEKARACLEGFVIARYNLYKWVYLHHKVTLLTTLTRELVRTLITRFRDVDFEELKNYINTLARFITGQLESCEVLKITDHYLTSLLINLQLKVKNKLNYISTLIDSIIARKSTFKSLWKRDVEFLNLFEKFGYLKGLNRVIDELIDEWVRDPEQMNFFLNLFKTRLIHELQIKTSLNADLEVECINSIIELIRNDYSLIIIGYRWFEPESKISILSSDRVVSLDKVSPLVKSILDAWLISPHFFIYLNVDKLRCLNEEVMRVLKECIVSAFVNALRDYCDKYRSIASILEVSL